MNACNLHPRYIKQLASNFWDESEDWTFNERCTTLQDLFDNVVPTNRKLQDQELIYLTNVESSRNRRFHKSITIVIPFPTQLKMTPLLDKLSKKKKPLAYLRLSTKENGDIMLHAFYVYPNQKNFALLASPEERKVFRGMGRKLLCHAVFTAQELGLTSLDQNQISLEASGGMCDESEINAVNVDVLTELKRYSSLFEDILYDLELQSIPLNSDKAKSIMRETLCNITDNAKLVKYYSQTYGLHADPDSNPMAVKMSGKLSDLIKACVL